MDWKGGRKSVIILAADSSIHLTGKRSAFATAKKFTRGLTSGNIHVIDAGGGTGENVRDYIHPDLNRIAKEGKESTHLLKDAKSFWRDLIVSIFGNRFANDINTIIERLVRSSDNHGAVAPEP